MVCSFGEWDIFFMLLRVYTPNRFKVEWIGAFSAFKMNLNLSDSVASVLESYCQACIWWVSKIKEH